MHLSIITPATADAVPLDEMKAYARLLDATFDAELTDILASATAQVEDITGLSLASKDYRVTMGGFSSPIELPKGPVTAILSVKFLDGLGALQTVDPADYVLDLGAGTVSPKAGWPSAADAPDAVRIEFTAGYTETPAPLRTAVKAIALQWYENRTPGSIPDGVMALLWPYRRMGF